MDMRKIIVLTASCLFGASAYAERVRVFTIYLNGSWGHWSSPELACERFANARWSGGGYALQSYLAYPYQSNSSYPEACRVTFGYNDSTQTGSHLDWIYGGDRCDATSHWSDAQQRCLDQLPYDPVEAKNRGKPQNCGVGNPINSATGNKYQHETDLKPIRSAGVTFSRYYNSQSAAIGHLGSNWRHRYSQRIIIDSNDRYQVQRPDGKVYLFIGQAGGLSSDADVTDRLEIVEGGFRYTRSDSTVETYNSAGRLESITNAKGLMQTMTYGAPDYRGRPMLASVTDAYGATLSFSYDRHARISILTDPQGGVYRYGYGDFDNLSSITYPDGSTRTYHYEDESYRHALTGITDENSDRFATWAYDDQGRAILSEHAGGAQRVDLVYNPDGTTTVTDALGATRTYAFSTHHGVIKSASISGDRCTQCAGSAQASTYDANGFLASKTDWNGNLTTYVHNSRGLEISRTEAAGTPQARTLTTEWHPDFRRPTLIDEPGKRTEYSYDDSGQLLSRTERDTATGATRRWTYTYTAAGLLDTVNGPRTQVNDLTDYDYDAQNNRVRITNALGHITQITAHDAQGRPLTLIDANAVTTTLGYHPRGWLASRTVGSGTSAARTTFDYDKVGNLIRLTSPDGATLDYRYDAAHRLIEITDPLGNRIEYTLDALGNRTGEAIYDTGGVLRRTQSQVFDPLGRLIASLGAGNQRTGYGYDANGNCTSVTDPLRRVTGHGFDALNRLISTLDADNGHTGYTYDARDNLTTVTDPRARVTQYRYDGLNNRIEQTSPDTGTTTYTHDAAGNRLTRTDARGITTGYHYDALNRLSAIGYPDSALNVNLTYDQGPHGIGRLTGMSDAAGSTTYGYDAHGNLISQIKTLLGVQYTTRYAYDLANNLRQITYPSGHTVDYIRDAAGQITTVTTTFEGLTQAVAENITYLPFGAPTDLVYGNGLIRTDHHDLDYRLTQRTTGAVQSLGYGYDVVGNIQTLSDRLDTARSQDLAYDVLDRLISAQGSYGSLDYGYDALGNRTHYSTGTDTDSYHYEATSNRLQSISGPHPNSFSYDAAGNLLQADGVRYRYDDSNRLAQASPGSDTARYTYNGQGQRLIKTVGAQTTVFHYDPDGRLLAETDAQGTTLREYLYLGDRRLALVVGEHPGTGYRYTFQGPAKDGRTTATLTADLDARTLSLRDSAGREFSHQFSDQAWTVEEQKKRRIIRFTGEEPIKLSGRLVFHHQGDDEPSNDTAQAELRLVQPLERSVRVRYADDAGQTRFTGSDRKTGEPVTTAFALDERRLTLTFAEGEPAVFDIPEENWRLTALGPNHSRIDYRYDDGHSRLEGRLRLKRHKTTATLRLQQGQPYRAHYRAMTGQLQTPVSATPGLYYLHTDHLDTPQVITDEDQQIVWRGDQKPFGEVTVTVDTIENPLRFPGQYYDQETGLHYNYFRDYAPNTGRYIESDPIGLVGGLNTYAYANQNPLRYFDPDGRQPICFAWPWGTAVCAVAAIGAVASVKQCSDGLDDVQEGFINAERYRSEQQQAIDCLLNPSCGAITAQQHADAAQNAAQQAINNAASATQNLGTSIPGTSATGSVPTSVVDVAVGAVVNAMVSQ
ncbi:MAG: RHS repeat-associated core domain-containing protein [Pseudomonadota bacterium]